MVSVTVAGKASNILKVGPEEELCPILGKHLGVEVFGMSVVVDDTLPKDWIEIRDPETGEVLGTIINVGE